MKDVTAKGLKSVKGGGYGKPVKVGTGATLKGQNKMLKDHYYNLEAYKEKLIEIIRLLSKNSDSVVYNKALNSLIFIKENIEQAIKNLKKYPDDTRCFFNGNHYLTKDEVVSLAKELLVEYNSEIENLQNKKTETGLSV